MSLRARLAVITSVLVAVGILVTGATSYLSTKAELDEGVDDFLRARADELVAGVRAIPDRGGRRGGGEGGGEDPLEDALDDRAFDPDAIVQVLDEDGDVVDRLGGSLPVSSADVEAADRSVKPRLRTVAVDGEDFRMITQHVPAGGAIQVARSLEETKAVLDGLRNRSIMIGAALAIVAAGLAWLVTARSTRPLRSLTETAEHVAATHDLNTTIDVGGDDEVGRLAASLDEMLAALRQSRTQQQQLIQDAGHELRTPLTALQANVELLQRAPDLEPVQRDALLRSIGSEVGELRHLFAELVELATDAREDAPMERIDLDDPAERALQAFRARSARSVESVFEGDSVTGNVELLERAIGNLLTNADKYSPAGSPVALTVRGRSVVVADRGPGIDPSDRDRVFDRFYRADAARTQPGSGLGLAIVKQIVDQHGGRVRVGDGPGGGAEVGFDL